MILKSRYKRPIINFDLGKSEATVDSGTTVNLHIANVYNPEFYSTELEPISGITISKINNHLFTLTPTIIASFPIVIKVTNTETGAVLQSNRIILIST